MRSSLKILYYITGFVILIQSALTAYFAWSDYNNLLALLAGLEAILALLFLFSKTRKAGGIGLIILLILAVIIHLVVDSDMRWPLLVYIAAIYHILKSPIDLDF